MSAISRSVLGPPWLVNLEFDLWEWVVEPCNRDQQRQGRVLELLADAAGGWWGLDEEGERAFIPLEAWRRRFDARQS